MKKIFYLLFSVLLVSLLGTAANSQTQIHTDFASFEFALDPDAVVTELDFDSLSGGDVISSGDVLDGFQFEFDFDGVDLRVGDSNTTVSTSTPNYVGTTDADMLQDGDDFDILIEPSNALGLFFITKDGLLDGDITLSFNGAAVQAVAMDVHETLADGSLVYFLGVTNAAETSTLASITTLGNGEFLYNVDDITRAVFATDGCPSGFAVGDVNQDGSINLLDVDPFIDAITSGDFVCEADISQDGSVNLLDVGPFVDLLTGG